MPPIKKTFSLREEKEFFRSAARISGKFGSLYVLLKNNMVGSVIVVPKTPLMGSVNRNLIKRRGRSIFSSILSKKGIFVYVAREAALKAPFLDLKNEIQSLVNTYEKKHK